MDMAAAEPTPFISPDARPMAAPLATAARPLPRADETPSYVPMTGMATRAAAPPMTPPAASFRPDVAPSRMCFGLRMGSISAISSASNSAACRSFALSRDSA